MRKNGFQIKLHCNITPKTFGLWALMKSKIFVVTRLMLEYGGVSYENRTMLMPKPEWLQYKHSLGFDFPNLPYYQVINYAFIEKTFLNKLLGG